MQAGPKDQPVYFERPENLNVQGVLKSGWVDASGNSPATPDWAYIISARGNEAFEAARTTARETIRCCFNIRTDVETSWRMKWNNQYYEIIHCDRSQQRQGELWITARLVGAK